MAVDEHLERVTMLAQLCSHDRTAPLFGNPFGVIRCQFRNCGLGAKFCAVDNLFKLGKLLRLGWEAFNGDGCLHTTVGDIAEVDGAYKEPSQNAV